MLNLWRNATRFMATQAASAKAPYPFSKTAIITSPPPTPPTAEALRKGKGLMAHLRKTLPTPEKQKLLHNFFSKDSPNCLYPGSIVTITMEHAPSTFTGVLLAIRRRGADTSIILRNIIQRTGVEVQVYVASPHVKDIKVVQKPPKGRMRRAKLYYLRNSPEKMSMIAGNRR